MKITDRKEGQEGGGMGMGAKRLECKGRAGGGGTERGGRIGREGKERKGKGWGRNGREGKGTEGNGREEKGGGREDKER